MVALLHKRVASHLLKPLSAPIPHSSYDRLPQRSHDLLIAFEDAVAALYAPQNVSTLQAAIKAVGEATAQLKAMLYSEHFVTPNDKNDKGTDVVDTMTKKMENAAISRTSPQAKAVDHRKWFDTCFEHIDILSRTILVSLDAHSKSN
jgi:cyclin-D1-binding protein 1